MHVREILGFMTQAPARRNKSLQETIVRRRRLLIESRKQPFNIRLLGLFISNSIVVHFLINLEEVLPNFQTGMCFLTKIEN